MDKKLYKDTIDSIRISDEAVENAIKNLKQPDAVGKVIEMKNKKHRFIKPVGAVAATLAIIIGAGVIFNINSMPSEQSTSNGFFITANAAATDDIITTDEFVTVGDINGLVGASNAYYNNELYQTMSMYGFDVKCNGENIATVTYSVKNGVFYINKSLDKVAKKEGRIKKLFNYKLENYEYYTSYTVDYDNQPNAKNEEFVIPPIMIASGFDFKNSEEIPKSISDFQKNIDKLESNPDDNACASFYEKHENEIFKDTIVTVTATYNDGTTESADMIFNSTYKIKNNKYDGMSLNAKLVN